MLAALLALGAAPSFAAVSPVGIGAFGVGSLLVDFTPQSGGQEVNGLSTGGLSFSYSLGNGQLIMVGFAGTTNNVDPLYIMPVGNTTGVLSVTLPELSSLFGFGYLVGGSGRPVPAAVTVTLFNGASSVGVLSFDAFPDPLNAGGFAGLQSTLPFNRAELSFGGVPGWAADNFRVTAVPEPAQWALLLAGVAVLGGLTRRRSARM